MYIYILNIYIYQCIIYIYIHVIVYPDMQNINRIPTVYMVTLYGIHGDMYQHIGMGQSRTAGGKQKNGHISC